MSSASRNRGSIGLPTSLAAFCALASVGAAAEMTLVSRSAGGSAAVGGESAIFGLSADGRYLAFVSEATNLVAGSVDAPGSPDAFLWDRDSGTVVLVSHAAGSPLTASNGASEPLQVSADGRYTLFLSNATNLVAGQSDTNGGADLFLHDRQTGSVALLSGAAGSATSAANGIVEAAAMSADGGIVAFASTSTNQVSGAMDVNGVLDLFLWERASGQVVLVSHAAGAPTTAANGSSMPTAVAADGDTVLFLSTATNLIAGIADANAADDLFVFRRSGGTVLLVSRSGTSATTTGAGESQGLSVSADGRYVLFHSDAADLVAGGDDANDATDVFLWDRDAGANTLVSRSAASATTTANGSSFAYWSALAADGRRAAFISTATDLVAGQIDGADTSDVFLWNRDDGGVLLLSHVAGSLVTATDRLAFPAHVSADGETVIFNDYDHAGQLVPGVTDPTNIVSDLFLWREGFETIRLASYSATSPTPAAGNSDSYGIALSADGRYVAVDSYATDLATGISDSPDSSDLFLWADQAIFNDGFGTGSPGRWSGTSP